MLSWKSITAVATCSLTGLLGVLTLGTAADPPTDTPRRAVPVVIQPAELRQHVEYLAQPALEGRGTAQGRKLAAEYLLREFRALKLKPAFPDSYVQEVPGIRKEDGTQEIWGANLAAILPGSDPQLRDEYIILSAHYDHLGIRGGKVFPGADDNASSVAMMLTCAKQLASAPTPPARSILFVAFDLEEHLLWGSRWLAAHPPVPLEQVKLFITADLLGRSLGDLPFPAVFVMGAEHGSGLTDYLHALQPPGKLELALLGADLVGTRSDYGPFRDERVPFLFFSCGEHPDYHTPQDTADRIEYDKLAEISNVILRLVQDQADTATPPVWDKSPLPLNLDEARAIQRITQLLLDSESQGQRQLTALQKLIVTQAHQKAGKLIEQGHVTAADRVWLVRSAQALLLSVF